MSACIITVRVRGRSKCEPHFSLARTRDNVMMIWSLPHTYMRQFSSIRWMDGVQSTAQSANASRNNSALLVKGRRGDTPPGVRVSVSPKEGAVGTYPPSLVRQILGASMQSAGIVATKQKASKRGGTESKKARTNKSIHIATLQSDTLVTMTHVHRRTPFSPPF